MFLRENNLSKTESSISSLYVCMVNIKLKYNFVETPLNNITVINLRGVSTKLYFNLI